MCVFSIGFGIRAPLLAVASTYIGSSSDTGKLYTILSITDAFTHVPGEPFIQAVWAAAINLGGNWLVLPFVVITVRKERLYLQAPSRSSLIVLGSTCL